MESIGEKLKQAREQKGLTHDQIARETNIAKRYLVALEEEDFQAFPGEPYLLGFLRNYADYLGLKSEELVSMYRNLRIQEQPIPVKELLAKKPAASLSTIAAVAGAVAVVAVVALIVVLTSRGSASSTALGSAHREKARYDLTTSPFEKRLYVGDALTYGYHNEKYVISLDSIADAVVLKAPLGNVRLALGEEQGIDLDADNVSELRASLTDFAKGKPDKGALLRFEFSQPGMALPDASPGASASPLAGQSPEPAADSSKGQVLIEARTSPYPFTMSVTFRQYCMFRHEVDRNDRTERYYKKGDQITANANNGIEVWASNATACAIQVIAGGKTVAVDLGRPGEVAVKNIKWVQTDSGWALTALPVD